MTIPNDTLPPSELPPGPQHAAEYNLYVEAYADGKGWESPRTWDIYDPRMTEITAAFKQRASIAK